MCVFLIKVKILPRQYLFFCREKKLQYVKCFTVSVAYIIIFFIKGLILNISFLAMYRF
jgi:hypothetical protein